MRTNLDFHCANIKFARDLDHFLLLLSEQISEILMAIFQSSGRRLEATFLPFVLTNQIRLQQ